MHINHITTALVALASISKAAPLELGSIDLGDFHLSNLFDGSLFDGSFTINRQRTNRRRLRSGIAAVRKAFRKYHVDAPVRFLGAFAAVDDDAGTKLYGNASATPEPYDSEYLTPVQIGNPPRTLMIDLDTGSADLWVYSNRMDAAHSAGHDIYDPSASTSAEELVGEAWSIQYGDSSGASGVVYADTVEIGGITATRQAIEVATQISTQFQSDQELDGLLGLGGMINNQVYPTQQKPWFDTVKDSLQAPIFCSYLKAGAEGGYDFGFLNPAHYTGDVFYTPADLSGGFWQITTTGFNVGMEHDYPTTTITSVVDTGTTLIFMQDDVLQAYWSTVASAYEEPAVGGYIFLCTEYLPSFSITVAGSMRIVPGYHINYAPAGNFNGQDYCYGGIQSAEGLPFNLLGDVFLKSQYAVFDAGNNQVGFANQP